MSMSDRYMDTISPEMLAGAKKKGECEIMTARRRAAAMRIIAENLDGAYVTKRIIEKLKPIIPAADAFYLSSREYSDYVYLHIGYPEDGYTRDYDEITICDKETRRVNAENLNKSAAREEDEANEKQTLLDNLDAAAAEYNTIADRYAQIFKVLEPFMYGNIPYADYQLKERYKDMPLADLFADPEASALPDPIPLPVNTATRYTMDEFIAAVTP